MSSTIIHTILDPILIWN